ncbi:MAG: molybdopterin-dependent oxidoreductase [Thermodesulfobacteriota bacterium]
MSVPDQIARQGGAIPPTNGGAADRRRRFALGLIGGRIDPAFRARVPATDALPQTPEPPKVQPVEAKPGTRVVKSACYSCNMCCEVLVFIDEATGEIKRVEGDPESPISRGTLCTKGLAARDLVTNPGRLRHPLKRTGERGEGKWERISWDEALDRIAGKLLHYRQQDGPQGVAFLQGTIRGWSRVYSRLANAFGAVNHGAAGWAQCLWPRLVDNTVTFGANYTEVPDLENTRCLLVWGTNPPSTWPHIASQIMDARQRGAGLIVVDPYLSETVAKADIWLQLRPGTDTALALAMLHVIIGEELYDRPFVESWTVGFDRLTAHVRQYTPEWGETVTRVPASLIRQAARLYATTDPAAIYRCVALDTIHDSIQACRAVSILAAVTGNIGIPGGNVTVSRRGETSQDSHRFIGYDLLDEETIPLRRGFDAFPLLCDRLSPVPTAHMPTLWETIATGEPYPVKAALIFGSNALISYSNTPGVERAMRKLEFVAVCDLFMTPTAQMADIVLPASSWLERDNLISSFQVCPTYTIAQQKAAELAEARSDVDIVCALARKLGVADHFWNDAGEMYDHLISPTGLTFEEFKRKKRIFAPLLYRQYEKKGFNTPSGKVELYASLMEKNRCAPLPAFTEAVECPDTPGRTAELPYILTTGWRQPVYRHTENRENPLLREIAPRPGILIHPDTAARLGIAEGDPVLIETATGSATLFAVLTRGIHPDVVQATPGWRGRANINRVIPWNRFAEGIGSVPMRGIACRLKKGAAGGGEPEEEVRR